MTMMIRPKSRGWKENQVYVRPNAYSDPTIPNDVWVECKVIAPTSSEGRNVILTMTEEQATNFMKELKSALIALRS